MILRRYKGPAFAKYCPCFPPHRILGECKKTLPTSFPMHVGIPDCLMIHHCTVYNPIMIIHLFVMGLDNWSSAFTLSRFIDRLTPMTSHIWREKLPSEICILRNSKFELLKLNMCSILNKKINTNNFKYIFSFIYKKIGSRDNKPLSFPTQYKPNLTQNILEWS